MSREEMIGVFMDTPSGLLPTSMNDRISAAMSIVANSGQIEWAIGEWIDDYPVAAPRIAETLKQIKEAQ